METRFDLPKAVTEILEKLETAGYRADVVGGTVRDLLRGATGSDFDITTSALPQTIKEIFADCRTIDTGMKHGTVTVLYGGTPYEITTYRLDGNYSDHRHPDEVTFTPSPEEDLKRRDFTVNAMCYSPRHGLTDLFDGKSDLEAGILRAVGDPERRFREDALRILRALRFSSVLGFTVEEKTFAAARKAKDLLQNVSVERVLAEWRKLLAGKDAYRVIFEARDILAAAIPELADAVLPDEKAFSLAAPAVRETALFRHLSPENYDSLLRRLHSDRETARIGEAALRVYENADTASDADLCKLLSAVGEDAARHAVALRVLLGMDPPEASDRLSGVLERGAPYRVCDLAVNGKDLMAAGLSGEQIGRTLNGLLSAVIDGRLPNEKAKLLAAVGSVDA